MVSDATELCEQMIEVVAMSKWVRVSLPARCAIPYGHIVKVVTHGTVL